MRAVNAINGKAGKVAGSGKKDAAKGAGSALPDNSLLFFETELTDRRRSPEAMRRLASLATDMLRIRGHLRRAERILRSQD